MCKCSALIGCLMDTLGVNIDHCSKYIVEQRKYYKYYSLNMDRIL